MREKVAKYIEIAGRAKKEVLGLYDIYVIWHLACAGD
jgi:hypothetical protein